MNAAPISTLRETEIERLCIAVQNLRDVNGRLLGIPIHLVFSDYMLNLSPALRRISDVSRTGKIPEVTT
jgi:hypothetical protein